MWLVLAGIALLGLAGCFPFHHWGHMAPGHCVVP